MKDFVQFSISIGLLQSIIFGLSLPCGADTYRSESEQTTAEIKAYSPKYRERISTYKSQIDNGLKKGWLSPDDAKKFGVRIEELSTMEANASKVGYPKSELDKVEKAFTQFNIDLTAAQAKPANAVRESSMPTASQASDQNKNNTKH